MPRPRNESFLLVSRVVCALVCVPSAGAIARAGEAEFVDRRAGALEEYLRESSLDALLLIHLQQRYEQSEGSVRTEYAKQIALACTRALNGTDSVDERREIEERARALLGDLPEADAVELRLALGRAAYSRAERAAEEWRLRLNTRADADAAKRAFTELERRFADIAAAAQSRVLALEKQEEASQGVGAERELLNASLTSARRIKSMGHFLAGWSAYYIAELDPNAVSEMIPVSLRHFGYLLNAKPGDPPSIDRAPEQLLSYEHVARAAVGVALGESMRQGATSGMRWLHWLASSPALPEAVRAQLNARRIIVLSRAKDWAALAALADPKNTGVLDASLTPTDARLLAVVALEEPQDTPAARSHLPPLITASMSYLVSVGDIAGVLDLSSRYLGDLAGAPSEQFLPSYVRGLREHDRANRLHRSAGAREDGPAPSEEARRVYAAARRFFDSALEAGDRDSYASALPRVALLRAMSAFSAAETSAEFLECEELFMSASAGLESIAPSEAAHARRMTIRVLEEAIDRSTSKDTSALAERRDRAIDRFLELHPDHPAVARVMYDRAMRSGREPTQAADELLALPTGSPLADAARHQAVRLLYERWLACSSAERDACAADVLRIAEPVLETSRRSASTLDEQASFRVLATARRVLDCILSGGDADAKRARRALECARMLLARGLEPSSSVRAELEYRSLQIALIEEDALGADEARERAITLDPSLAPRVWRAMYECAAARYSEAAVAGSVALAPLARRVIESGDAMLRANGNDAPELADPSSAILMLTLARACADLWRIEGDASARERADELFDRLVAAHPRDRGVLRSAAMHWERAQNEARALDAWLVLVRGSEPMSEPWLEAKLSTIVLAAALEPARAREMIEQHRTLHPEIGPDDFKSRVMEIEATLGTRNTSETAE